MVCSMVTCTPLVERPPDLVYLIEPPLLWVHLCQSYHQSLVVEQERAGIANAQRMDWFALLPGQSPPVPNLLPALEDLPVRLQGPL